jgi:hypothetical protein
MAIAFRVNVGREHPPLQPLQAAGTPPRLLRLLKSCFEWDPQRRPSAHDVVKELLLAVEAVRAPPYSRKGRGAAAGKEPTFEMEICYL